MIEKKSHHGKQSKQKSKHKSNRRVKVRQPERKSQPSERQEEAEARQGYRSGELERRLAGCGKIVTDQQFPV